MSASWFRSQSVALLLLMVTAAWAAEHWKPRRLLSDELPAVKLEQQLPRTVGVWVEDLLMGSASVINPQATEGVSRLYSQVLTRLYVRPDTGERMMLSVAYGRSQQDGQQLHVPDVCYPSQGFSLTNVQTTALEIAGRNITAKRALATSGSRVEPLTYWTVVGEGVFISELDRKLAQMRYGFQGLTPDGLVMRASMLTDDAPRAWKMQAEFLDALVRGAPPEVQSRLAGK